MELYTHFLNSTSICTDTRQLQGGELFFCLRGDHFNGNRFAKQALEMGAQYVVMDDHDYYEEHTSMLLVKDSLQSLQALAQYHRKQLNIPLLGITGTNGKTTTKELCAAVLSQQYKVTATQGNFNNHIGVPLSLLQIKKEDEIAIIEMGANHADEIADLCAIAQPSHGIITNIGHAHLEGFGNFETIKNTKLALYKAVQQAKGTLFANADDNILQSHVPTNVKTLNYSLQQAATTQVKIVENTPLHLQWQTYSINMQLFGEYNAYNAAAAICIGQYFGITPEKIVEALESYSPQNNRSQIVKGKHNNLIMDAYNANPDSMQKAIQSFLKAEPQENKTLILGDMMELGSYALEAHRHILESILHFIEDHKTAVQLLLVGEHFGKYKTQYPDFYYFENIKSLASYLENHPIHQHHILLKGSRSIGLESLRTYLE